MSTFEKETQFVGFMTDENSDVIHSIIAYQPSFGLMAYSLCYGEKEFRFMNADMKIAYKDGLKGSEQIKYLDIKDTWHNIPIFAKAPQNSNVFFYPKKENNIIVLGKTKGTNPIYVIAFNNAISAVSEGIILDYVHNGYTLANADENDNGIVPSDKKYGWPTVNIDLKISYVDTEK